MLALVSLDLELSWQPALAVRAPAEVAGAIRRHTLEDAAQRVRA